MGDSLAEEVYDYTAPGLFYLEEPDGFRVSFTENEQNINEQQHQQHQHQQQERTAAQDIILSNIEAASLTEIYTRKGSSMPTPPPQQPLLPPPKILTAHAVHSSVIHSAPYVQNYSVYPLTQDVLFDSAQTVFYPADEIFCVDLSAGNELFRSRDIYVNRPQSAQLPKRQKRFPITVPTPRYYRKPCSASMVYKRPSALCFPIVAQPDPAAARHHHHHQHHALQQQQQQHRLAKRKDVIEDVEGVYNQVVEEGKVCTSGTKTNINMDRVSTTHRTNSAGDANANTSEMKHLENMLHAYECQARHGNVCVADQTRIPKRHRLQVPKCSKLKTKYFQSLDENPDESKFKDLIEKLKNYDVVTEKSTQEKTPKEESKDEAVTEVVDHKSFNYQDISSNLERSQSEAVSSIPEDKTMILNKKKSKGILKKSGSYLFKKPALTVRKSLDDMSALELHHSKSYIVDLIDRALSKELGTIPNEVRQPTLYEMSPKQAISCVNKYSSRFERPLCTDLPPSILDYRIFKNSDEYQPRNYGNQVDTPLIKQLKEMRWGHLKRIQKEVKDLENLERFLEFCYQNPCNE